MCGPRGLATPLGLVSTWAGTMGSKAVGGGCRNGDGNGAADGELALLRCVLFSCFSIRTNSFTIVRLVLTPCRFSNSAMASQDAPFPRNSMITSRHGWRFPKRGRRRGSNCAAACRIRCGSTAGIRREMGGKLPGKCAGIGGGCPPEMRRQYPAYMPDKYRASIRQPSSTTSEVDWLSRRIFRRNRGGNYAARPVETTSNDRRHSGSNSAGKPPEIRRRQNPSRAKG